MRQLFYQLHGRLSAQQLHKLTEAIAIAEQAARDAAVYWADELQETQKKASETDQDKEGVIGALVRMRDAHMSDAMEFSALKSHVLNHTEVLPKEMFDA